MTKLKSIIFTIIIAGLGMHSAGNLYAGKAQPIPMVGTACPYGYGPSSKMCKPLRDDAKPASIKKNGYCPAGTSASGGEYCLHDK